MIASFHGLFLYNKPRSPRPDNRLLDSPVLLHLERGVDSENANMPRLGRIRVTNKIAKHQIYHFPNIVPTREAIKGMAVCSHNLVSEMDVGFQVYS